MKNVNFHIKKLTINRMPGFSRGMDTLKLAQNINLITGPNASGKSSTSRMIQQVIWPFKTKGLDAMAEIQINDEPWQVKIESEAIKTQRDGIDNEISGIPSREGCHRYLLPLHDLIKEDENDLAREIMKASIGGYDLDEAKSNLGYSRIIKNSSANEYKEVTKKEVEYKSVLRNHQELKKEEEKLRNLRADKDKARQASQLYDFYNASAEVIKVKQDCENLKSQKSRFSTSMETVSGDEIDTISKLEHQRSEALSNIQIADSRIEEEQQKIGTLQISETEISDTSVTNLETRLQKIKNVSTKLEDLEAELFAKHEERCEAVKAIDESLDPLEWERLDLDKVEQLDEFIQDAYRVFGIKENLENEKKKLKEEIENFKEVSTEPEDILQGIKFLGFWIKEQNTENDDKPKWVIPALVIIGALTALFAFIFGWPGLFGILLIIGIAIYASKTTARSASHSLREKDFKDLKLPLPTGWSIELVIEHINLLLDLLSKSKSKEKISLKQKELNRELEDLSEDLNKILDEQRKWREEIGSVPKLTDNNFGSLYWFLVHAKNWQKAHTAYKSLEGQKTAREKEIKKELEEFNTLLKSCNLEPVKNETEAAAELIKLKNELKLKNGAATIINHQESQLIGFRRSKKDAEDKLTALYKRLIVPEGDKTAVKQLIGSLESYKDCCNNLFASEQRLVEKENILRNHSFYTELEDSLESLTLDLAEEKAKDNQDVANKLEEISGEITGIETLIKEKKKGHELEDLLTEKDSALDGLLNLYQNNLASVTGDLLIEQLKAETQEQNRPMIFKRANVLFSKITNGRYELRLDEKDNPSFTAFDTVLRQGLSLSEVSTGTRVQLLLAVRLAYVESQEKGIKLPILADELLANSDDERAAAIIKALIEISKEGRQVFYFTAQADEIYKWESILKEEKDLEYGTIILKDHHNQSNSLPAISDKFRFNEIIAEPGTLSHAEYRKLLKVGPFNPLFQDSAQLHLWYLIDDTKILFNCLSLGLKTWGQLESFRRLNGRIEAMTSLVVVKVEDKIKLLERLIYLSRKGQDIAIDREVLENSGAVSASFIEEVWEKLKELNGDPKSLITALTKVKRFKSDNIAKLENYLIEQQILSEDEPLTNEETTSQLAAVITQLEISAEEAELFCNYFTENVEKGFVEKEKQ